MRYIKNLALLIVFVGLCGFGAGGGGGGSGAPAGAAGGDLGGTYPNPTVTGLTHAGGTTLDNVAIGGTTSSTGQFTKLCIGTSPCTLPGSTGQFNAGGMWAGLVGATYSGISGTTSFPNTGNEAIMQNPAGDTIVNAATGQGIHERINNTSVLDLTANSAALLNGSVLSATGGTAPTATCSGGSTGVVVSAGNSSCTASVTPFPCCTGNTTGTCSGSTDNRGTIQTSSSASTNCTITFNHTWPQTPVCIFDDGAASVTPIAVSGGAGTTTTYVFDFASATSKVVNYHCM